MQNAMECLGKHAASSVLEEVIEFHRFYCSYYLQYTSFKSEKCGIISMIFCGY